MRVLLVTPMPPRADAPAAIPVLLHALLLGLVQRNDVTLVTVVGDEPGEAEAGAELQRSGLNVHVIDRRTPQGVTRWRRRWRLATTWVFSDQPWRTVWFADPKVQTTLNELVASRRFDVAAVEDSSMGGFDLGSALPTVLTEYEVVDLNPIGDGSTNWATPLARIDRRRSPGYQAGVWRRFELVQVMSERDARTAGERDPEIRERLRVTPFGIELPQLADPARENPRQLLFTGNFAHLPNRDAARWLIQEIMPPLRAMDLGASLDIVGSGATEALGDLEADDVRLVGEVPSVAPYLESAAIVLAPVRTGGGMRMKVLHALGAGRPVVTTTLGAEGLLLRSRSSASLPLVIADDADAIAEAVARLLRDHMLRRQLGAAARAFVAAQHSPDAYARRLESVYAEAIERRSTPAIAMPG